MKNFIRAIVFLFAVVLVAGCTGHNYGSSTSTTSGETATTNSGAHIVEITSSGFSPSTLTINSGDTVTFTNKDTAEHWPASAVHPTHVAYPESGGCIGSKFDACKNLAAGESWSFTFNQVGTWKYHDHLNPGTTGTIVVQ